jgi:superfamily I DNA/RNA helicase
VGKVINDAFAAAGIPITGHKNIQFGDKQDTVKLITVHTSKGLEFPLVAIPGASIPSGEEIATEEEARLLYVAMTRATKELLVLESEAA